MKYICVTQGAARAMMEKLGDDGLVVDGRKLFFEYRFISFFLIILYFVLVVYKYRFFFFFFFETETSLY